jgi:hypothetical protein
MSFKAERVSLRIEKNRWARGDSNARPSPCKGEGFELVAKFSTSLSLASLLQEEETTTRKASAPSCTV